MIHESDGSDRAVIGKVQRITVALIAASIIGVVITFYSPFLNNFFAFDDFRYIENLFSTTRALLFGYNTTRFLSNLVFAPLYAVSGYNPLGYNLFSLLLHITNALLFAGLVVRISGKLSLGGLAGVIFASSAALADSLLWKCANNTLMSAFFSLFAFHLYLSWRSTGKIGQRFASLILFIAAMFSKEDASALPLLILCYELIYKQQLRSFRQVFTYVFPYVLVVVLYVSTSQILIRVFQISLEHYERFLSFRPFYALMGGFSAFLMNPGGKLDSPGLAIAVGTVTVTIAFFWVKNRRLLLFALIGIFITFLPSSLTSLGSFTPKYIFQSVSRYLYLPSAMAALALACILLEIPRYLPKRAAIVAIGILLCLFLGYNYEQVSERGRQWHQETEPVRTFLESIQKTSPNFPDNSYIFVIDPPVGRAYVQQALRAFYQKPTITWITDPRTFTVPKGSMAYMIVCHWLAADNVQIETIPF